MILCPLALGKEETTMQLYVKGFHGHHSLGDAANSPTVEKVDVKVRTLDSYCSEKGIQSIAFLKIDVEGFEEDVLLGANSLLKSQNIGLILFEIREKILTSVGRKGSAVFAPLLDNGYKVISFIGNIILSILSAVRSGSNVWMVWIHSTDIRKGMDIIQNIFMNCINQIYN